MLTKFDIFARRYLANYLEVPPGFGKVAILIFIESLAMSLSFYISMYFSKSLAYNQMQIGNLISIMLAGNCCGALVSGNLTRFLQAKTVSAIGFILLGVAFLCLTSCTVFYLTLLIMFCFGVSSVLMMNANLTSLVRLTENVTVKKKILVLQSVIFNATVSIVAYMLNVFEAAQLKTLFIIMAVSLIISGVFTLNLEVEQKINNISGIANKRIQLNKGLLLYLTPMIICYSIVFALVKTYFAIDSAAKFNNHWQVWGLMSINPLLVVFFQPLLIYKLGNKNNIMLLALGVGLLSIGYLLFGLINIFIFSLLVIIIATLGEMIFAPISKTLASVSLGVGNEGMGLAFWKVIYYVSGVIGASTSGYIGHVWGHVYAWFICIPLIMLIAINYAWFYNDDSIKRFSGI